MYRHLISIISIIACFCASLSAQTAMDSVTIHFHQGKINLDPGYMNNRQVLDSMTARIKKHNADDSLLKLAKVSVIGAASPEGSVRINEWLSHRRAERIFDYINTSVTLPDSITSFEFIGRDWRGLREAVENDSDVPYREDVIALIDEIITNLGAQETEAAHNLARLKRLHGGEPYTYLYRRHFPKLRESRLMLTYIRPISKYFAPAEIAVDMPLSIPQTLDNPVYIFQQCRPFYMGIKTNMLYDALAVPEIGAEFYLGKDFSIVGNWMYGWWKTDPRHRYWRIYGGDLAFRWWFGEKARQKPLTGHHIGLYAGVVTYDFEFGGKGYMGGKPGRTLWDRCNYYGGIEYGYSMPIARRLNIDFTLGLGYLGGEYREYVPIDQCYVWQATKKRNWFGPTKAEISLVWLIGCDNYNRRAPKAKKGGAL